MTPSELRWFDLWLSHLEREDAMSRKHHIASLDDAFLPPPPEVADLFEPPPTWRYWHVLTVGVAVGFLSGALCTWLLMQR